MQIEGGEVEAAADFLFLGSKITSDSNCSHEMERHLLLGWKAMTNLDNMLKSRESLCLTNVCTVKAMGFPVVKRGCKSYADLRRP